MKRVFQLLLMFALLSFCQAASAAEKIKIGVSTALTGSASTYGQDIKNFVLFANKKLAGGKYELIFEDDKCSGKDAVNVAHKLIDVDKVKYVIGFACSGALLSAARLYEKAGVIAISPNTSAPAISQAGDYIFRTWPSDAQPARLLADFIADRHKVLGVISEETDYAQGFYQALKKAAGKESLAVYNENFLSSDTDFKSLLLLLKQKGIDALFINSQTEKTFLLVLKQVREMKLSVQIYGAYWPESQALLSAAEGAAEGIRYISSQSADQAFNARGKEMLREFRAEFGPVNSIEMVFGTSFEAFRALHQAIESGGDVREYLGNTEFDGLFGKWRFDKNGDIEGVKYVIKVIRNNKPADLSRLR